MKTPRQPRIATKAKGSRPQYFADPATDRLLAMLLTVVEELSVTRDRLDALERLAERHGLLDRGEIAAYRPDETAADERAARRERYLERLLRAASLEFESDDEALAALRKTLAE